MVLSGLLFKKQAEMQLCSPTVQFRYTSDTVAKLCAEALQKHFFTK